MLPPGAARCRQARYERELAEFHSQGGVTAAEQKRKDKGLAPKAPRKPRDPSKPKAGQLVESAVYPACRQHPTDLAGRSEASGLASAPRSAA